MFDDELSSRISTQEEVCLAAEEEAGGVKLPVFFAHAAGPDGHRTLAAGHSCQYWA